MGWVICGRSDVREWKEGYHDCIEGLHVEWNFFKLIVTRGLIFSLVGAVAGRLKRQESDPYKNTIPTVGYIQNTKGQAAVGGEFEGSKTVNSAQS